MISDNGRTKLIEQYLLDELQGADLLDFQEMLRRDMALREETELQHLLMKGIENRGLRKALNHIHYDQGYDSPFRFYLKQWKLLFVGIIFLVFSFVAIFFLMPPDKALEKSDLKEVIRSGTKIMNADNVVKPDSSKGGNIYEIYPSVNYASGTSEVTPVNGVRGTRSLSPSSPFAYENGIPLSESFQLSISEKKVQGRDFKERIPHISHPHLDMIHKEDKPELVYYKVFEDRPETRIIVLPAIVLDYDILYTHRTADPLMNERVELLLSDRYANSYTSTTQFHWRIEGCQLYGTGVELMDIYLNHVHLKLWEADSLVIKYLNLKAYEDCENFTRYMKAAEYFRWLKSLRHGTPVRINALDNRHYRQGQLYNKLPDKALKKYLSDKGLTSDESSELIEYFKKTYYYRKMFYRQKGSPERAGHLNYYYQSEGKFTGFKSNDCSKAP